jgi:hypothetical protein
MGRIKTIFLFAWMVIFGDSGQIFAQSYDGYLFNRSLQPTDTWHRIPLPEEIYRHLNSRRTDLRIIGVNPQGDTLEVPWVWEKVARQEVKKSSFKLINIVTREGSRLYTLVDGPDTEINTLHLDIAEEEFDWKITLEGSANGIEWFTLVENYRLVAFRQNGETYRFTRLQFPTSRFSYYRISFPTTSATLRAAWVSEEKKVQPTYQNRQVNFRHLHDTRSNTDTYTLHFPHALPVVGLRPIIRADYDYFRPFHLHQVRDSVKTEKGWRHNQKSVTSGFVSSLDTTFHQFAEATSRLFIVTINNKDNAPLPIEGWWVEIASHTLIARFPTVETINYRLIYGAMDALMPEYDLVKFQNSIPSQIPTLVPGPEEITKIEDIPHQPFIPPVVLWTVLFVVILVMGGFVIRMMKSPSENESS